MRLGFRLYKKGALVREETHTVPERDLDTWMYDLCSEHAKLIADAPHMIEIEFLDEPDPDQRYFRFGTDASGMVLPLKIKL